MRIKILIQADGAIIKKKKIIEPSEPFPQHWLQNKESLLRERMRSEHRYSESSFHMKNQHARADTYRWVHGSNKAGTSKWAYLAVSWTAGQYT